MRLRPNAVAKPLDSLFQVFGGPEGDLPAGLDLDDLAGRGIASHTGGALPDLQNAETGNADAFALFQVFGDQTDQIAKESLAGALRQLMLFSQSGREMLDRNRGAGFCSLSFGYHNVLPSEGAKCAPPHQT